MERDIDLTIENLRGGLRNYGYTVESEPLPGMEAEYADELRKVLKRVEDAAEFYRGERGRNRHRYRGHSKALLAALHRNMPEPGWAVRVSN